MSASSLLDDPEALAEQVTQGDARAVSRLITLAEREDARAARTLRLLQPHTGRAHVVGITGVPGGGKSTLVDQLISFARDEGLRVGVLAIDPSSRATQGAILADRVRMQRHANDKGTFVRSLGTRGDVGGLSAAAWDVVRIMDASGSEIIFIETVGAGQVEADIVSSAHTVVVVGVPGLGDSIQAMKAGLMEIADIFIVNMADRPDAQQSVRFLQAGLRPLKRRRSDWKVPVLTSVATSGEGVEELWRTISRHRKYLQDTGAMPDRLRDRVRAELLRRLERRLEAHLREQVDGTDSLDLLADEVASGGLDIQDAVIQLWEQLQFPKKEDSP